MHRHTRRDTLRTCAAVTTAALAGCVGGGGDASDLFDGPAWSQYRGGPGNEGTAASGPGTDLGVEWTWDLAPPDAGEDDRVFGPQIWSPLVAGEQAYLTAAYDYGNLDDGIDGEFRLFAVDLDSGETAWSLALADDRFGGGYTPATDGERVYVTRLDDDLELVAVDLDSGEPAFESTLEQSPMTGLTLADGTVYYGGGTVHARGTDSGTVEWDLILESDGPFNRSTTQFTPPTVTDDALYVGLGPNLLALDRATGEERWRVEAGHQSLASAGLSAVHSPVHVDGTLYLTSGDPVNRDDGALIALDPADGSEQWRYQPPIEENRIEKAREGGFPAPSGIYGVPTPGQGVLYGVGFQKGEPTLFAVETDGRPAWSTAVDWRSTSPLLADGLLYVPTGDGIAVFDASDGSRRGSVGLESTPTPGVYESPALTEDRLLVPTMDGLVSLRS